MFKELEGEWVVDLPVRLETATFFSPITTSVTQTALAVNAVNAGGVQQAVAGNVAAITVSTR